MKNRKKIVRKLGGIERYHLMLESYLHTNVTMYVTINGEFSEAILQESLKLLQNKFTLLKARINRRRRGTRFEIAEGIPIPLRIEKTPFSTRNDEIEKEVNTMMPIEEGPLVRFVLLNHEKNNTLIMTVSHTIADGVSGIFLLNNLLSIAARLYQGKDEDSLEIKPDREVEYYFPQKTKGLKGVLRSISLSRQFFKTLKSRGGSHTPDPEKLVPFYERQIQFITRTIDTNKTVILKEKAAERGVNLNSVLAAAYFIACAKDSNHEEPAIMAVMTQVNLRSRLKGKFESIGNCASSCNTINTAGTKSNLWEVASDYYNSIIEVTQTDEMFLGITGLNLYDSIVRWIGNDNRICRAINNKFSRVPQKMTLISNVGAHAMNDYPGAPFTIESGCAISSSRASGMIYSIIMTVNGTLSWNIVANSPLFERERIELLLQNAISIIEAEILK